MPLNPVRESETTSDEFLGRSLKIALKESANDSPGNLHQSVVIKIPSISMQQPTTNYPEDPILCR